MDSLSLTAYGACSAFLCGVSFIGQVAPLDPGWADYLVKGGAAAAILFQSVAFCWVLKYQLDQHSAALATRDKQWLKTLAKHDREWKDSARDRDIALLECTATMMSLIPIAEAATQMQGITFNPSESIIVAKRRVNKGIEDLRREKDVSIKKEAVEAAALDEDSQG